MKKNLRKILDELARLYPSPECTLDYSQAHELLFSTRLAAQCTDARVNIVSKTLYEKYPTLESFASADIGELEETVRPCGFYHTKADDIKRCAEILCTKFDGAVPDNMEDLLSLPGIGRKTANLILGELFRIPAVVVDTHCLRLSNRLGFVSSRDPQKVELTLREILPPDEQLDTCHRFVHHGRAVCTARSPKCGACTLNQWCPKKL